MPAAKDLIAATKENDKNAFEEFRQHANGTRIETKSNVLNIIRNAYPDYHVTEVDERDCSLFEFAAAGKATVTLDSDEETFDMTRNWKPVGEGIERKMHPGQLVDDYRFAR